MGLYYTIVNKICPSHSHLMVAFLGLLAISSLLQDLSSTKRIISSRQEFYVGSDGSAIDSNVPFISSRISSYKSSSKLHYTWDEMLETRYSTTHQKIRGQFSMILNDRDETNSGNNDFQHKGILRTSSEKHGKWMKLRFMRPDTEIIVAGETIHKAGTNYSKFVDDMRLIIDANQTIMNSYTMNSKDDNSRLCHILRLMTGRNSLDGIPKVDIPPVVLNVTADCNDLNGKVNGQGNMILALYGLRMITALAKVDFEFQCNNNNFDSTSDYKQEKSRKLRWVFPWFASHQPASNSQDPWPFIGDMPTQDQVCSAWNTDLENSIEIVPLEKMAHQIRNDVRKMTLQLIGSQQDDPKRTHLLIPLDVEPWIPDIAPDDVIIHFPCYSDLNDWEAVTAIRRSRVGILQFNEYTKHIHKNVRSIGIIREFSGKPRRDTDDDVCHRASTLLLEYLRNFYSNQPVSISVYENESLPLQYARIAMAQQSFSSFSTFGMIPIIGTFGKGYFQPSTISDFPTKTSGNTGNHNSVIRKIVLEKYEGFENLNLMNGNVLSIEQIATMSFKDVSKWLLKSLS